MWPAGMKTPASAKTMIHENPEEAESDIFQELDSSQILLTLPDPNVSFELENYLTWLRCEYWKETTKSVFFSNSYVYMYVYVHVHVLIFVLINLHSPGFDSFITS